MQSKNSKENSYPYFKYELEESPPPKNRKFGTCFNQQITSKYTQLKGINLQDPQKKYPQKYNDPKIDRNHTPKHRKDDYSRLVQKDRSIDLSSMTHDGSFRRRDFDMRFNNIEAISEQISGLFDYVRKTEKKEGPKEERSPEFRYAARQKKYSIDSNRQLPKELEPQSYYVNTLEQEKIEKLFAEKEQMIGREHRERREHREFREHENEQRKPDFRANQINTRQVKPSRMARSPLPKSSQQPKYKYDDLLIDLPHTKSTTLSKNLTPNHSKQLSQKISKFTPNNIMYQRDYKEDNSNQLKQQESRSREDEFSRIQKDFRQKIKQRINNIDDSKKISKKSNEIFFEIDNIRERIKSSEKRTHEMEKRYLEKKQYIYENFSSEIEESANQSRMVESKVVSSYSRPPRNSQPQNKSYNDRVSEFKINLSPVPTYEKNAEISQRNYEISATNRSAGDSLECDKKQIVTKLIKVFSEQIDLDKRLRNARSSFCHMLDSSKWKKLKSYLEQRNFCYTEKQLEKELEITPGEIDPFAEDYDRSANHIEKLGDCFIESQKFWEQKLTGVISKLESDLSKFSIDEIDLSSKGYITIEDLVCFINLYGNTCFRNRDVLTLYRRFMALSVAREGIDMKGFMNKIVR